jgi:nitroreductase
MESAYSQILERFSVRRYQKDTLQPSLLTRIHEKISSVEALDVKNTFSCHVYEYDIRDKASGALGIYGRIFQAPYFLAPGIQGDIRSLVDLGFRTQQIILDLWREGIGSCYVGCVHQQSRVIDLLDLPENVRVISMAAFGIPLDDQSKHIYQQISQAFTRSKRRMVYEDLFLGDSLSHFENLSEEFKAIIEAGRQAPSATNAQPWRFNINQGYFEIFAARKSIVKLYDLGQEYTLHDVGICMANMSRAAKALGEEIQWEISLESDFNPREKTTQIARFKINR